MPAAQKRIPYEILPSTGYAVVRFKGNIEMDDSAAFTVEIPKLGTGGSGHIMVNCAHLKALPSGWIRALVSLARQLKEADHQLRLVCVEPSLMNFLRAEGVDKILKTAPGLKDALTELGLSDRRTIDIDFVNPFLDATVKVLEVQAKTLARPGKIFARPQGRFSGDVSGVIGIVAESFKGSVIVSFPSTTFLKVMSRMLGEEYSDMTQELAEGAGELVNIIFGRAKLELNNKGYGIQTALPSVVTGNDHHVANTGGGPVVVIPFETDVGGFFVEICTAAQTAAAA